MYKQITKEEMFNYINNIHKDDLKEFKILYSKEPYSWLLSLDKKNNIFFIIEKNNIPIAFAIYSICNNVTLFRLKDYDKKYIISYIKEVKQIIKDNWCKKFPLYTISSSLYKDASNILKLIGFKIYKKNNLTTKWIYNG